MTDDVFSHDQEAALCRRVLGDRAHGLAEAHPADIARAAVIGMGSMGTGIAHALIIAGVPVVVLDEDEAALGRGAERIRASVGKRVDQGKLATDRADRMLALLSTTADWQDLSPGEFVTVTVEVNYEDNLDLIRTVLLPRPDKIKSTLTMAKEGP